VSDSDGARRINESVKASTVAVVYRPGMPGPGNLPSSFSIAGSGFCVHPQGVIVTCRHVVEKLGKPIPDPHVIFYHTKIPGNPRLYIHIVPVYAMELRDNFDLATLKITPPTEGYKGGYPTLSVLPYVEVHEMMEIATCGFPLGDALQAKFGTITSSFLRGIISSIIPAPDGPENRLRGFQLDLTSFGGNSGGPVFSLATGQVFAVFQSVIAQNERPIGLALAGPIYPLFADGDVECLAGRSPLPG
jgi:S1-C subfamily serine protease